ncbi:efflux RND transporter periplasmic adaptor subunit [Dokdonella sp.]|uniref:efflux RND transporter periplasmic adaptor subunit n=1 Tax=Dokdonella sp. TaxID=2291710 RepID=UPI001B142156|nr:efflux RND transporter periplasmic adaptor subunit [Dokdonella sp.]MBO9662550.1 efflux RND transporter periplasmic adaptor subunit [Dokdonella sp.]
MKLHSALTCAGITALAAIATGCGKSQPQQQTPPPPEVGVVAAKAQSVPLTEDLTGRLTATRSADVRARVPGVLQKRVYTEGSDVKQGQVLFEIDPAPLRATLNAQQANLASAQATYTNNRVAAERARSVASKGLLSKADLDNAAAAERTAAAAVKQAQANVEAAKINLGYTSVTAPIAGRAGQQQVTEGALVGQGEATLLTTVEQIDPIYVNFTQAVGQLDSLRAAAAAGSVDLADQAKAKVELLLPDGTPYSDPGTLDFSDQAVDAATGAVSLRGIVPNPQHRLLPGQFVNVRLTLGDLKHAWLISQRAVQRDTQGAFVMVVGADGKVEQKRIKADRLRGDSWIVTDGLADGDQIIVSGLQKAKPGQPAKATPWQPEPAKAAAPAQATAAH